MAAQWKIGLSNQFHRGHSSGSRLGFGLRSASSAGPAATGSPRPQLLETDFSIGVAGLQDAACAAAPVADLGRAVGSKRRRFRRRRSTSGLDRLERLLTPESEISRNATPCNFQDGVRIGRRYPSGPAEMRRLRGSGRARQRRIPPGRRRRSRRLPVPRIAALARKPPA